VAPSPELPSPPTVVPSVGNSEAVATAAGVRVENDEELVTEVPSRVTVAVTW